MENQNLRVLLGMVVSCGLLSLALATTDGVEERESDQLIEHRDNGRVYNYGAAYSFLMPLGWELAEDTEPLNLNITDERSESRCSITGKVKYADIDTEFKLLRNVVAFAGGKWTHIEDRWRYLGGRRAGQILSSRERQDSEALREWDVVVVYKRRTFIINCTIPQSALKAGTEHVEGLLRSIRWGAKKRKD
jgi:hypothetical protein